MRLLAACVAVLSAGALTVAVTLTAAAGDVRAARHVVQASGSSGHGFHLVWSDGEEWWTPTLSEERALCTEYHRALRRARCEARVRAGFRWMGVVKRSLRAVRR